MSKSDGSFSLDSSKSFKVNAETFLQKTNEHVLQGINPGGISSNKITGRLPKPNCQ